MFKRASTYVMLTTVFIGGVCFTYLVKPIEWLQNTALAQAGCQTFQETGKQVCGKFLTYWQQHGGLAQQGLPISNSFSEISDLNGKTYTVQYFERAVFEDHPENAAPYDVLLSQLGTFQLARKYPGGDPSGGGVPVPTIAPAPTGGDIFAASGEGQRKTDPFSVSGNIKIDWTATDTGSTNIGCYHGMFMKSSDAGNSFFDLIVNASVDGGSSKSGTTNEFNLKAGNYYFDISSGCQWTVRVYR